MNTSLMSNTVREFSALLKAEVFFPEFARKLIWAPVLSTRGNWEQGLWAQIQNSKIPFLQAQHSQDLVQDKVVMEQLKHHDAAMDILPWSLYMKKGYWWFYPLRKGSVNSHSLP